jgi:hypothetical protein
MIMQKFTLLEVEAQFTDGDFYLASEVDARIAELEHAIKWALGEEGDFPGGEPPSPIAGFEQRYFWRTTLRQLAKL